MALIPQVRGTVVKVEALPDSEPYYRSAVTLSDFWTQYDHIDAPGDQVVISPIRVEELIMKPGDRIWAIANAMRNRGPNVWAAEGFRYKSFWED